jgi:hypothetical protein
VPRLLACYDCGDMTFLNDYEGAKSDPKGEFDMALIELTKRHQHPEIPTQKVKGGQLFTVDQKTFDKYGNQAVIQIKEDLAKNQIWMNDFRDELKEDAMACFNKHGRPDMTCSDAFTKEKAIGRTIGVPKEHLQYLCMYCPFGSGVVAVTLRQKKGYYK